MDSQTSGPAQTKVPQKPKSNKPYLITLGCLGVLILGLGIANLGVMLMPRDKQKETAGQTVVKQMKEVGVEGINQLKPLEELTEDEVIEAYTRMMAADYTGPEGMIDAEILEGREYPYFILEYSYDEPEEIVENDYNISNFGKYELELKPIGDYAMLVTANTEGAMQQELMSSLSTSIGIAFDKDYIDYYEYEEQEESDSGDTYTSHHEKTVFVDTSEEFLQEGLPLWFLGSGAFSYISSIYDYKIEFDDEQAKLIVYNIGLGFNMGTSDGTQPEYDQYPDVYSGGDPLDVDYMFALNLYTVECTVDLETGEIEWARTEGGGRNNIFKSYPLTSEKAKELSEMMYPSEMAS